MECLNAGKFFDFCWTAVNLSTQIIGISWNVRIHFVRNSVVLESMIGYRSRKMLVSLAKWRAFR